LIIREQWRNDLLRKRPRSRAKVPAVIAEIFPFRLVRSLGNFVAQRGRELLQDEPAVPGGAGLHVVVRSKISGSPREKHRVAVTVKHLQPSIHMSQRRRERISRRNRRRQNDRMIDVNIGGQSRQ